MRLVKLLLLFNHNKLIDGINDDILDAAELSVNITSVFLIIILNYWTDGNI